MNVYLLIELHLEFLSLKGGYNGSSESSHVKRHIVGNHMSRLILLALQTICRELSCCSHPTLFQMSSAFPFGKLLLGQRCNMLISSTLCLMVKDGTSLEYFNITFKEKVGLGNICRFDF